MRTGREIERVEDFFLKLTAVNGDDRATGIQNATFYLCTVFKHARGMSEKGSNCGCQKIKECAIENESH